VRFEAVLALQRIRAPQAVQALEEAEVPFADGVRAMFPAELIERVRRRVAIEIAVDESARAALLADSPEGFRTTVSAFEALRAACLATGPAAAWVAEGGRIRVLPLDEAVRRLP
jgi:hypothetical protein